MKRSLAFILFLLPIYLCAYKVTASVNKSTITLNDRIEYTIQISNDGGINVAEPVAPQVNLLSFVSMNSSMRSSTTITGLKTVTQHTKSYTYIYLPQKVGKTVIPSQRIRIVNNVYTTPEIPINIVKSATAPPSQQAPHSRNPFSSGYPDYFDARSQMQGTTMLLAFPSSQFVFKGEPVVVSYYLYTDQMVRSFNLEDELDFSGYGKSTFEQPNSLSYEVVTYQGKRFQRALIKRLALSPNELGILKVPQLEGTARIYAFGYTSQEVKSAPTTITVKQLPKDKVPISFSGAVGTFTVTEGIATEEINLGEALTMTLKISGRGNFNQFSHPIFNDSKAQISSPVSVDKVNAGIEGNRTLYYTIIPKEKGIYHLPALSFSWFDTASGSFKTYTTKPKDIRVKSANVISYFSGLWDDGSPKTLKPMLSRSTYKDEKPYITQAWYWVTIAIILCSAIVSIYFAYLKHLHIKNPILYANKRANSILIKYLEEATNAAKNLSNDFYPLAEKGLLNYLAEKFTISNRLSTSEKIAALRSYNIPEDLIFESEKFLEKCSMVRFMPDPVELSDLETDLGTLRKLVEKYSKLSSKGLVS